MQRADPVLVFDLDGTVLCVNSFPVWVLFLAFGRARKLGVGRQLRISATVLRLLMLRKLGRIRHPELLHKLQELWRASTNNGDAAAIERFVGLLAWCVRSNFAPILKLVRDGTLDGMIATAAAEDYAAALGQRLGVPHVLATRTGRKSSDPDNIGVHKRDGVIAWLHESGRGGRPLIFFNDHIADLPLMRECDVVCWFGSSKSLQAAREAAPGVRFVDCRKLTASEMHATVAHLCQSVTFARMQAQEAERRANTFA